LLIYKTKDLVGASFTRNPVRTTYITWPKRVLLSLRSLYRNFLFRSEVELSMSLPTMLGFHNSEMILTYFAYYWN